MEPLGTFVESPLECTVLRRLNRFVVEVLVAGTPQHASINNTGRLEHFLRPGTRGFCTHNSRQLKTAYRLFAIRDGAMAAVIDTRLQMRAFEEALRLGLIPWLQDYVLAKRNASLGTSVIDYLLVNRGRQLYLETKSAVLRSGSCAMYPDCPSARGRRHIRELIEHAQKAGAAAVLFIAALPAVEAFKPNRDADPELADLLLVAGNAGVVLRAIGLLYNPADSNIYLYRPDLPVELC
jgi:sugar fermentation stimulation protein A